MMLSPEIIQSIEHIKDFFKKYNGYGSDFLLIELNEMQAGVRQLFSPLIRAEILQLKFPIHIIFKLNSIEKKICKIHKSSKILSWVFRTKDPNGKIYEQKIIPKIDKAVREIDLEIASGSQSVEGVNFLNHMKEELLELKSRKRQIRSPGLGGSMVDSADGKKKFYLESSSTFQMVWDYYGLLPG